MYTENSNFVKSDINIERFTGTYCPIVAGDIHWPNKLRSSNEIVKPRWYKHYEMFQRNNNAKDKAVLSLDSNIYIYKYKYVFFSCGAAAQRGPWPPHS